MTTTRIRGKVAIALTVLALGATLPGSAVASHGSAIDHHTCDPATPPGCPAFDVSMQIGVQNAVTGSPSGLQFLFGQPDRSMPVMKVDYYLPTGWRFASLSDLEAAGSATSCNDLYDANGNFSQAEGLGADTGMRVIHNATDNGTFGQSQDGYISRNSPRDDYEDMYVEVVSPGAINGVVRDYGVRNISSSDQRRPSVVFLNWDGTTATICYYHRNNDINAAARDFRQTALLTRLSGDPLFDWKVSVDVSNVVKNPFIRESQGSVLSHHVGLPSLTAGNWTLHPVTGLRTKMPFSTAPQEAGAYPFRGAFSTCAGGLDPNQVSGCKDIGSPGTADDFLTKTIDQVIDVVPAPSSIRHQFGLLSGPKTAGLCGNSVCPMGLVSGSQDFTATWSQPAVASGTAVKGYVLVIAEPGNQASRVFKRIITNPDLAADPDYSASACGDAGCSLDLSFPMQSSDGSTTLHGDRKYHLGLVTMYTDTVRRSDGVCDNPAGATQAERAAGTACPSSEPTINVVTPGYSTWQVLMLKDVYPHVYVETADDSNNNTYDAVTNRLLLVDFDRKQAEFIVWNTNDQVTRYFARTNTIVGANGTGGTAVFGSQTLAGPGQSWQVAVRADTSQASGYVVIYDLKNPSLTPPAIAGLPVVDQQQYSGDALS